MGILAWAFGRKPAATEPSTAENPRQKENRDFNRKQQAAYEATMLTIVTGSIDRAKNSVTVVQATSSALLVIYTGLLGFTYSTTAEPLPFVAVLTPIFLGAAIVLATYYTSFVSPTLSSPKHPEAAPPTIDSGAPDLQLIGRIDAVTAYVTRLVRARSWALRAAVVALACGLACIALPFVQATEDSPPPRSEWVAVALPTDVPPGVAPDLRDAYFAAQIADAQAKAESERVAADPVAANPLNTYTGGILLTGTALILLAALPGLIVSARDRWSHRTSTPS